MNARACVTTAKGTAAIASILIEGPGAGAILAKIFKSATAKKLDLLPGNLHVGDITDNNQTVDHVVVACNGPDSFEICCHGNPLIVEAIMRLLATAGAQLTTAEEILTEKFTAESKNAIAAESKLQQLKAATVEGVRIIAHQSSASLAHTAGKWLSNLDSLTLEQIAGECKEILARSQTAKLIIDGCKAVIAGPPNSGKSTLLNCLAGRQKAIVTDIAGTTRDWVSAECRIGPLVVEFIDTAGQGETLAPKDGIDRQAQNKASDLLSGCDLILFVIDTSRPGPIQPIQTDKPLIVIGNKSDLATAICTANTVQISAKTGNGIDELTDRIQTVLGVSGFGPLQTVCFTDRQVALLKQLAAAGNKMQAKPLITELLNGRLSV